MTEDGVLYIATGKEFVSQAQTSAESLKKHNPDVFAGIITSSELQRKIDWDNYIFDDIVKADVTYDDIRDKALNIRPLYDRTLYLDTDTYISGELQDAFDILDRFDMGVTHAPLPVVNEVDSVPRSFPEVNGGVLLYRDNKSVLNFISKWRELYRKQIDNSEVSRPKHDQAPLREALYHSNLRIHFLPREYNCRAHGIGTLRDELKILHAPPGLNGRQLSELATVLNKKTDTRVYFGFDVNKIFIYDRKLEVIDYPTKNIAGLVSDSIDDKGVMETIRRAGPYIKNKLINRINY